MIKAIIFDLDGTLIQTEVLKADSYAMAMNELTNDTLHQKDILEVFHQYVGLSRQEVVSGLSNHFMQTLMEQLGTDDIKLVEGMLIEKRLQIYRGILDDMNLLSKHFCPFTLGLLHRLFRDNFILILATMSHLPEAKKVTEAMGVYHKFDLVLTRDDVRVGKPAPDIYLKALSDLALEKHECLVIEDSVNGILAAQKAGLPVMAVTNNITRESVLNCKLLDPEWIIDDLRKLDSRVYEYIQKQSQIQNAKS